MPTRQGLLPARVPTAESEPLAASEGTALGPQQARACGTGARPTAPEWMARVCTYDGGEHLAPNA